MDVDQIYMRQALGLAKRGYGRTSPNPMVGAVLVRGGRVIGKGWHRRAGAPHAEVEAIRDAESRGETVRGATLYVTLEPCCTFGRTPPCTAAIMHAAIRRVVVGAIDPNPAHHCKGLRLLRNAGIDVVAGVLENECSVLNEAFNHWIVHRTPLITVKAAMSLDGKIGTRTGESKWITGAAARALGMRLRKGVDAILVGINTVLADNPALTVRAAQSKPAATGSQQLPRSIRRQWPQPRRLILDSTAATPLNSQMVTDEFADRTTVVVTRAASAKRITALERHVQVWIAPGRNGKIDLRWVVQRLGTENVTSVLVEGGGEANASFLLGRLAHRVVFFYAPMVIGGVDARKAVSGRGAEVMSEVLDLTDATWRRAGTDLVLTARIAPL